MILIQSLSVVCFVLFGLTASASPLDDSTLADQTLAIIGARVPNSTQKCAGCHRLDATKLRTWFNETVHVAEDCLLPWNTNKSLETAEATLGCISVNGRVPFQWGPKKLGLYAARVNSGDFAEVFSQKFGGDGERELNKFRQRAYMPRSGSGGFTDEQWALVTEYIGRGAPLLEQKLSPHIRADFTVPDFNAPTSAAFEDSVVVEDLSNPWSVNASPDGQIWITEQDGQIKIYDTAFKLQHVVKGFADLQATGQGGLLDLAFHPRFLQNGWIYVAYTVRLAGGYNTQINRYTYRNGSLAERQIILNGPSGSDGAHFGSRLVFDDAGFLYASFGERHQKEKAQSLDSLHGKTVRVHDDGRIPADNPFAGKAIYTYGHRNSQGLAIHPVSKLLFDSEHGPTGYDAPGGGDEVNLLKAGANYGWPVIHHRQTRAGMESALREYTPSVAPSGIAFYTGDQIPQWKNDLFVTTLAGATLLRFTTDNAGRILNEEKLFEDKYGRLRDVGTGPDGSLLIVTDNGRLVQVLNRNKNGGK